MKKTITLVIVFFFLFNCSSQSIAPSVINASGGSFQSGYYQLEWSIGELALVEQMTSSNNSLVITNGFIQPFIEYPATINTNNFFGNNEIKIFPNPASSYVEINFLSKQRGRITLSFYDGSGRKILSVADSYYGVGLIKRIPVSHLPNEVYMLHVDLDPYPGYSSKKGVYKIVKIK
ncbi:MAG TPA: T9SS type A sorting domain-containing protein [Chitinophagaceae bacterium]|nr:T9SS type A sorting domain-containing protein [Chitinophagaceae bacterium]